MKQNKPLFWVLRRIRKRLPSLIALMILSAVASLLNVWFALGMKRVIDCAVARDSQAFWQACLLQGILVAAMLILATVNRHLREMLTAHLERDWKKYLFHGTLHGEYAQVSRYHTGELLNLFNNDTRTINEALLAIFPGLVSMLTQLVAGIIALAWMEPVLTAVILAGGIVLVLATSLIRKPLKKLQKRISAENGKVSGFLQEILEKLLMVQAMDVSVQVETRAGTLLDRRFQLERKRKHITVLSSTCINILALGAGFVVLVWGASGILKGAVSYGTLTALMQLVNQVRMPMLNLSGVLPQYVAMTASAERLMELEEIFGQRVEPRDTPQALFAATDAIVAEEMSFAYDRDPVFRQAGFTIPKSGFGVITGQSGIGKSTLLKLMLGIFQPQEGQLFLQTAEGRIPLDRTTRGLFAYVPQGNLLLSGTLRDNLILIRPDATEEEIREAVFISCMDEFLDTLPQGLDTVLGESAQGLSEGQAQRLSIARAVLSQAPIMLLDEATSALDPSTEKAVLTRLRAAGRTCIAVTHRPAAVEMSDWQLEMADGRCVLHRTDDPGAG